jgi:hypothetical protein
LLKIDIKHELIISDIDVVGAIGDGQTEANNARNEGDNDDFGVSYPTGCETRDINSLISLSS